jgi:hypothetical protein
MQEFSKVKGRAIVLRKLLEASSRKEFTEEHCATMRERLIELFRGIRLSPAREAAP